MSKAFTRESDDAPERPAPKRPAFSLPTGVKNYFTASGLEKFQRELEGLGDSAAERERAMEIEQCLDGAVAVASPAPPWEQVLFGATVVVRDQDGAESTYRIVGPHEADIDRNWISHLSPLARALLKKHVNEKVHFRAPVGEQALEIIALRYE